MNKNTHSIEHSLIAALTLLSSSALRGPTAAKTEALRMHLRALSDEQRLGPELRDSATELLTLWKSVHCHPASRPVDQAIICVSPEQLH